MRRVAIISPYFPPSTLAGVHRARHLAKHLPAAGWTPTVLCVDETCHEQRLDWRLAGLVPAGLDVVKVGALPATATRFAGVGDIGLRAYLTLARGLRRILERDGADVVMITGSPFYPMLLARMVKRQFGTPVVLDFQDPWAQPIGQAGAHLSKAGASAALARRLEPVALSAADFVTSVSDRQNDELAARYPWLDRERMAAIPIGGDADDYAALAGAAEGGEVHLQEGRRNLVYVGTLLPRAVGVVRLLFRAVKRLCEAHPGVARSLHLTFVGTSNQPDGFARCSVGPLAAAEGVAAFVTEVPQRVPYLEALGLLARADAILLIGSDEPHYTASKIYPALLSGRPSIGLFHRSSSATDILSRSGGARVVAFDDLEDLAGRTDEIGRAVVDALGPRARCGVDHQVMAPYQAAAVAARFADVFERVSVC